jgi:hypothetical protein
MAREIMTLRIRDVVSDRRVLSRGTEFEGRAQKGEQKVLHRFFDKDLQHEKDGWLLAP